ncbi:ornithine cyclodeaminase family protein [Paenibacillus sp. MMS20-IR301]|uniref:ornithine cyclodeaminase family protein n=1 Tax=Paenibacillus sp. MMS20-IR301 TaxID=2895946 RepID=UPI0028E7DFBC|nr:ornithine cyclodeaminase family protein [Paenibacillus sp. MMS20-IR301]WNS43636.1 ornithine cyclodeaminase family protein [Paenibacillus sp. MMS20-IR301]
MIIINEKEVAELLTMEACITVMEAVLADLPDGGAVQSLRQVVPLADRNLLGLMPGYLRREGVAGAKLISVFPHNHDLGLPSHQGMVALFDAASGTPLAIVNGQAITAIRTAAVSAAATKLLAREDAAALAVLGTGEQARCHVEAMLQVRRISRIAVWGRTPAKAAALAAEMGSRWSVAAAAAPTAMDAVRGADIICTATAAVEPVLQGAWVKPGAHINAVGACRAHERELDTALVAGSRLYVDRRESAVHEAGDYLIPLSEGAITAGHITGELGELLTGRIQGRTDNSEITLFKGLGLAVEDLAAAFYIYKQAALLHKGTEIKF